MPPLARILVYGCTAAGFGIMIKAVVDEPPPLWFALAALFGYVALVSFGVVFARFSMFADVVTEGPKNARGVALTFDDGPDPATTPQILEHLEAAGIEATFFVIGRKAEQHQDLLREISERGHAIGIHSWQHERVMTFRSPWHVRKELEQTRDLIQRVTGTAPFMFRAPIGHISPAMGRVVKELDLVTMGWSVRGVDGWAKAKPDAVAERVIARLRDGAIVLLHDAAERGDFVPASIEALPKIIEAAQERNLRFVRVDAWLGEGDALTETEAHDAA
jgi:peptidoglycan/xylan/chitin deacetylase (PgdA/CDA1 family)